MPGIVGDIVIGRVEGFELGKVIIRIEEPRVGDINRLQFLRIGGLLVTRSDDQYILLEVANISRRKGEKATTVECKILGMPYEYKGRKVLINYLGIVDIGEEVIFPGKESLEGIFKGSVRNTLEIGKWVPISGMTTDYEISIDVDELLSSGFLILADRGFGKTLMLKKIIEKIWDKGLLEDTAVIIIDPRGDVFSSLRSSSVIRDRSKIVHLSPQEAIAEVRKGFGIQYVSLEKILTLISPLLSVSEYREVRRKLRELFDSKAKSGKRKVTIEDLEELKEKYPVVYEELKSYEESRSKMLEAGYITILDLTKGFESISSQEQAVAEILSTCFEEFKLRFLTEGWNTPRLLFIIEEISRFLPRPGREFSDKTPEIRRLLTDILATMGRMKISVIGTTSYPSILSPIARYLMGNFAVGGFVSERDAKTISEDFMLSESIIRSTLPGEFILLGNFLPIRGLPIKVKIS